jgi:hypothetical protein
MYVRGYLQSSENGRVVTMALNRYYIIIDEVFFDNFLVIIYLLVTAGLHLDSQDEKILKI